MEPPAVVLVTGASTGIGRVTAGLLSEAGYRVVGTSRAGTPVPGARYRMVPLELSSDASVQECVRSVLESEGRIDVLVNNAGFGVVGAIEETTDEQAQAQMEVFLFGIHRMVRAVLPAMRAQRRGRIIQISSSASVQSVPFAGLYSAGKRATAGFTEALRYEVRPFGIDVSYLEATMVRTEAAEDVIIAEPIDAYRPLRDRAIAEFREGIRGGKDPNIVAEEVLRMVRARRPRIVHRVDLLAKALPVIKLLVPQRAWDLMIRSYVWSRRRLPRRT